MASSYRDAPLKDEVERLFFDEHVWVVRLEVIKSISALKLKHLAAELQVEQPQTCLLYTSDAADE